MIFFIFERLKCHKLITDPLHCISIESIRLAVIIMSFKKHLKITKRKHSVKYSLKSFSVASRLTSD